MTEFRNAPVRGISDHAAASRPQIPAMINVHSHAFQRDMRGAAERLSASSAADDFWSWRTAMFDTVAGSTPTRCTPSHWPPTPRW